MSFINDFPHTSEYDKDLGWLIQKYKDLNGNYETLIEIYEIVKQNIKDITLEQLKTWLDDGTITEMINNLYMKFIESLKYYQDSVNKQVGALENSVNKQVDYLENNVNLYRTESNQRISAIDNKVNGLSSSGISPKFVNNTNDMTNISQIYVKKDTGHLYYYNGSNFVDSGLTYGLVNGYVHYNDYYSNFPSNKLSEFPSNTIVSFTSNAMLDKIVDLPVYKHGTFINLGNTNILGGVTNIYTTIDNHIYYRIIWGSVVKDWVEVVSHNTSDVFMRRYASDFEDFNYIFDDGFYPITSKNLFLKNMPIQEEGMLLVFGGTTNKDVIAQYYVTMSNKIYYRIMWSTSNIKEWIDLTEKKDIYSGSYFTLLSAYPKVTFCGDSLTYSQVYTSENDSRRAYKPYPQVISNLLNIEIAELAKNGVDCVGWWNTYKNNISGNSLYIIYLGTNNGLTDTVEQDCVGDNLDLYGLTQTGYYGRILRKIQETGGKAILVKVYATSSEDVETTNKAIEKLANRFNCAYVNNELLNDSCYHTYPDGSGVNQIHYNDIGYSVFANNLLYNISNMPNLLKQKIIPN